KGKSGVLHQVTIVQPKIAKTIKQCIELPGFELFQYIDENGDRHVIDSGLVNEYLSDTSGEDISAKEFRTWGGTVLGAVTLNELGDFKDKKHLKENLTSTVKEVSDHLRNTPAVCRNYYIHPVIFKTYEDKKLIPHFKYAVTDNSSGLLKDEYRVITLLQKYA
ncbi:MAG: DNA topoisomerase IB, partial [Nanoarchaeota archaeon]